MPKGYWIARVDVQRPGRLQGLCGQTRWRSKIRRALHCCAAARSNAREGGSRSRNVVLEFKDYATAKACYDWPEYQKATGAAETVFGRRFDHHRRL